MRSNSDEVLAHVARQTGVELTVLSGADEARLTFLAVRRWFGWSAGRLAVFDIGGGSLEIAGGTNESPDVAWSLPLGAARLARQWFDGAQPSDDEIRALRKRIRAEIARDAGQSAASGTARPGRGDLQDVPFVGQDLWGGAVRGRSSRSALAGRGRSLLVDPEVDRHERRINWPCCPGSRRVGPTRSFPGALVAEAVMDIFGLPELEICPWALREGVILERLDRFGALS